jgi:hypothetical protein
VFEAADMFDVNPAPFDNHTCLFIDANLTLLAAVPAQDAAVALSGISATLASKVSTLSDFARSALSSARLATPDLSDSSLLVSSWNEAREYMVSTVWGTGSRRFDNPFQLAPQAAPLPSDDASQFALNAINFSHQAACQRFLDWLPQHKRGGLTWPLRSLNDNERSLFVVIGQAALYQYWVHANSLALRPETVPATNGASLKDPLQVVQRFNALLNDLILAQNETIPERPETFAKVQDIARSLIDLTERYLDSALVPRNRFGKTKLRLPTP